MGVYSYDSTPGNNSAIDGIASLGSSDAANIDNILRTLASADKNGNLDLGGNTAGGSADALTLSLNDVTTLPAYADKLIFGFVAASDNATTTPTLNIDSVGAKVIKKSIGGTETALNIGDIQAGAYYLARYRSSWDSAGGAFQLIPMGETGGTFMYAQGTVLNLYSEDAGATGPSVFSYHNSATPAANDILMQWTVGGESSTGSYRNYGQLQHVIYDATNASEDSYWVFKSILAGTEFTSALHVFGDGIGSSLDKDIYANSGNSPGFWISSSGADLSFARYQATPVSINRTGDDGILLDFLQDGTTEGYISVSGTTVSLTGAHLSRLTQFDGAVPAPLPPRGTVMSNADAMCVWKELTFQVTIPGTPEQTDPQGNVIPATPEKVVDKRIVYSGAANPGDVISHNYDGQTVSATVVLSANDQLNKMTVSSVVGDRNVAGVLERFDADGEPIVAQSGDFLCRIAQGVAVNRGDLLVSNGDGCAVPQADDFIRSSTIGKVSSSIVAQTYPDGSYLVPVVLMAGG